MRRVRIAFAALATSALLVGVLASVVGAQANGSGNGEIPWPILKVNKTIGEAEYADKANEVKPPEGTTFYVRVTCDYPNRGEVQDAAAFPTTVLTFDHTGAPKSADQGGWQNLGDGYWTYQGSELKNKLCTAVEYDVTDPDGASIFASPNLFQQYKCVSAAAIVEPTSSGEAEAVNGATFGCVNPPPFGTYVPDSENASVQFTHPWDYKACPESENGSGETGAAGYTKCQQTGTLTVDNFDPAWNVVEAIEVEITFTG